VFHYPVDLHLLCVIPEMFIISAKVQSWSVGMYTVRWHLLNFCQYIFKQGGHMALEVFEKSWNFFPKSICPDQLVFSYLIKLSGIWIYSMSSYFSEISFCSNNECTFNFL